MLSEFRFAARTLVRWRGGLVASVVTLALGIGTATALSALVHVLLADVPGVPAPDSVARIFAANPGLRVERSPAALHEFDSSLSRAASFAAVGGYADEDATIGAGAGMRPIVAGYASPGFFAAMGVPPAAGRVFNAADVNTARPVVLLSDTLWRREFPSGDFTSARIVVDGTERRVIGVMPPAFSYPFIGIKADLWIPLARAGPHMPAIVTVFARLRDDVDWSAAADELRSLSGVRGATTPASPWTWRAIPIEDDARQRAVRAYAVTLGPALLMLLIASVNVAYLLMARGLERERELAVRRALGASRGRVVRLLIAESLVLAFAGGAGGAAIAAGIVRAAASALSPIEPSMAARLPAAGSILPAAILASVLACLLFGGAAAFRASRAGLTGQPAPRKNAIDGYGLRDAIVFAEVASAVGLVVWAALLLTLFGEMRRIRFTFPAEHVIAIRVPGRDVKPIAERVGLIPGVTRTAMTSGVLGGAPVRVATDGSRSIVMSRVPVGEGFFETLGVPLIRGRSFAASELHGLDGAVVLSESAAARLAPGRDPIGMRVRLGGGPSSEVIGVCRDAVDYGALGKAGAFAPSEVYVPYEAAFAGGVVLARVPGDANAALQAVRDAIPEAPGAKPVRPVVLADEIRPRARDAGMLAGDLLGVFAIVALALAANGVFAVISLSVVQRRREFAIRLTIGDTPRGVLRTIATREGRLIGAAIATGLVFTMAGTRALFEELVALGAIVPSMWIGGLALSAGAVALACLLATREIGRLDLAAVLRRP